MPRIDEQPVETKRPFKKKPYRPWNLMDDDFAPTPKSEGQKEKPVVAVTAEPTPVGVTNLPAIETPIEVSITTSEEMPKQTVIKKESISNQLDTKEISVSNHTDNDIVPSVTTTEPTSKPISNPISNQRHVAVSPQRAEYYVNLTVSDLINRVSGLQRKILFHIVENCILSGTLSTSPIASEELKQLTNADKDTIKTAIQRLINKSLMTRGYGKKGKGGFAIFCITEEIRNAVIDAQKRAGSNNGLVTSWVSNKESLSTYSSGSNNINTTTKEDIITSSDNANKWENIDIEPLCDIGFTKSHLQQIIMADRLPSDIVQDSIYAFAFDLENNNKQKNLKTSPLNYFMGILRTGAPYAPPANYESPQDKAMRLYLEQKKEAHLKRQAMEDELLLIAFSEWESNLTQEEKDSLLSPQAKVSKLQAERTASIRLHFREQVWPSVKSKYTNIG